MTITKGRTPVFTKSASCLYYRDSNHHDDDDVRNATPKKGTKKKQSHSSINVVENLEELKHVLVDDQKETNLVTIQFYAPWCKTCQKLKLHYNHLASKREYKGKVQFVKMQHTRDNPDFTTLRVRALPTVQVYYGPNKVYEISGIKTTKEIENELKELQTLSPSELNHLAKNRDDGIFKDAITEPSERNDHNDDDEDDNDDIYEYMFG